MFDMTKVKVGDKVALRNSKVVEIKSVWEDGRRYPILLSNGCCVTSDGYYWENEEPHRFDVINFVDENQQTVNMSEEMQAVEMLLSLGYTLKKVM